MKPASAYHVAVAFLVGVAVAAVAGGVRGGAGGFVVFGAFAFLFGGIVGLPVYAALRRFNAVNLVSVVVSACMAGVLPVALLLYPQYSIQAGSSVWLNEVPHYINGVATDAAWSSYYESIATAAFVGALAGACFWIYLHRVRADVA